MPRAMKMMLASLICLLVMAAFARLRAEEQPTTESPKGEVAATLTNHEEAVLRKCVYPQGLATYVALEGPWKSHRLLAVPKELAALYKEKPLAVLKRLLTIVEGGRPEDAISASAYAAALVEGPPHGVMYADYMPEWVDDEPGATEKTERCRMIEGVERMVSAAKK